MAAPDGKSETRQTPVIQTVKLTLPKQESIRWDIQRTLPLGRWSILYRDAKAGEGVQLVVGRVTTADG